MKQAETALEMWQVFPSAEEGKVGFSIFGSAAPSGC